MAQIVDEIMTPVPVILPPEASLASAASTMRRYGIGDVLVAEDGRPLGLVTDRDIVVRAVAEARDPDTTTIAEICSTDLVTVSPEDDADTAVRLMREHAVRRIPVVDSGEVVGVVSIGDIAVESDPESALADISAEPPNV
jgi:CBS domain-containing protein